jgi:hypothetical protein
VLQYQHSYYCHAPTCQAAAPGRHPAVAGGDLASYLRAELQLAMVVYASLLRGGYVRPDKLAAPEFAEYATRARPPGWPRCAKWPRSPVRRSTRWCWPG